jgi:hypothetical protein
MLGATSTVRSRRQASWPARNDSNIPSSAANALRPSPSASEKGVWHELPSRSSNFAM